jgi:hypothetical protein
VLRRGVLLWRRPHAGGLLLPITVGCSPRVQPVFLQNNSCTSSMLRCSIMMITVRWLYWEQQKAVRNKPADGS